MTGRGTHLAPWVARGLCVGADPRLWFGTQPQQEEAKTVCADCPVIVECRAHALAHNEREGVWGGLTQDELDRIRRKARRSRAHG